LLPFTIKCYAKGKMLGTPEVPDDMLPQPRPLNEMFVDLPGGHTFPQNGLGMCCRGELLVFAVFTFDFHLLLTNAMPRTIAVVA
jgi:hypothetical protein